MTGVPRAPARSLILNGSDKQIRKRGENFSSRNHLVSLSASARLHGRTPRSHSGDQARRLPVESVKSRLKTAPSRLNREVATRNGSAESPRETEKEKEIGERGRRRGRKNKWDRKRRTFFLGNRAILRLARESIMNSLSWESFSYQIACREGKGSIWQNYCFP